MNKAILSAIFILSFLISNAQYRTYKHNYSPKEYSYESGDRYKPGLAAAIAILPGAGHIYIDQPLRGLIFPAGMLVSAYLISYGSLDNWASGWSNGKSPGDTYIAVGLIGFFGIYIWNFLDVIHVAKIKNLYFRDNLLSFQFEPFYGKSKYGFHSKTVGLTVKISLSK